MREAVTESENFTVNEIVRAKKFSSAKLQNTISLRHYAQQKYELIHGTGANIPIPVNYERK